MNKTITAHCQKIIQFYDLDPMNVVWHGHYPRFFEEARCVLLDQIHYNYPQMQASGYQWPIVDLRIKYLRPLFLFQTVTIEATLLEYENRLKIAYCILDSQTAEVCTKAESIQVAVDATTNEMQYVSPAILIERVQELLNEK